MRHVCGADCGGGVDQDSRSGGSVYPAVFVYHAGGDSVGGRRGALAVCVYLALGLAGLPIFAQGGGLSYLLQPSFGYLIGFAAGAFVTGTMARSGPVTFRRLLAANLVGLGVVYLFGMLYYYGICQVLGTPIGFGRCFCMDLCWPSPGIWCCVWWGLFWACACFPA